MLKFYIFLKFGSELNLQEFPFDTQNCSINVESWTLDQTMMRFNDSASLQVDDQFSSYQWTLCQVYAVV